MAVVKFSKQNIEPNPLEVDYWVDIKSDPYGSVWKYHNGINWVALNLAGGSGGGGLSPFDYYTKTQINDLLADKADIDFVESKVDDAEFAKVIQNIEFRPIGDNSVELVMLKYDGVVVGITMPVASETSAGLLSGDDFKNFVKQAQLQKLYSEMYDIVSKIREEYQPRLKAGSNIYIDEKTNTISATGELAVNWEDIPNIPIHLVQSVSTENEVINVDETFTTQVLRKNEQVLTEDEKALVRANINVSDKNVVDGVLTNISKLQSDVIEAIDTANTAKTIVTTLEGLANADEAMLTLAEQVALIEENKQNIQLQDDKIAELGSKLELPLNPVAAPVLRKPGKAISENGIIVDNANYSVFELSSDYRLCYIEYYSRVLAVGLLNVAYYDANGDFISGEHSTVNDVYVRKYIPKQASLIRISIISAYIQDVPIRVVYSVNEALDKVIEITNDLFVDVNNVGNKTRLAEKMIQVNTGNTDMSLFGYTVSEIEWEAGAINGVTGAEMPTSSAVQRTPFVNIEGFDKVNFSGTIIGSSIVSNYGYAFYDENQNYIGGAVFDKELSVTENQHKDYVADIPDDAVYFRTSRFVDVQQNWYMIIAKGKSLKENIDSELTNIKANFAEVKSKSVEFDAKIGDVQIATKDYTVSEIEWETGAINGNTGNAMTTSSSIKRTKYLDIEGVNKIYIDGFLISSNIVSNFGCAFYDKSFNYISGFVFEKNETEEYAQKNYILEVPNDSIYFRTCRYVSVQPDWYMRTVVGKTIREELDDIKGSIENGVESSYRKGILSTFKHNFTGWYKCRETSFSENFKVRTINTSYSDLIGYYDNMMVDGYMSKSEIGKASGVDKDGNEYPIYLYTLKPKRANNEYTKKNHPKILIDSSMHGSERQCAFGLYYFIKDIIYNYKYDPILYHLRNFVEIQFVPISNPWGYDNDSYLNANAVNLNRNFPDENWVAVTEPNSNGLEPLDQPESRAINDWIKGNRDMLCYINMHTNGVRAAAQGYLNCNAVMSDFGVDDMYFNRLNDAISNHIEDQTAQFGEQYENMGTLYGQFIGKYQQIPEVGTLVGYAIRELKHIAVIFEEFGSIKDSNENIIVDADSNQAKTICAEMLGNFIAKLLIEYSE